MPYPQGTIRVSHIGSLNSGEEEFSFGFSMRPDDPAAVVGSAAWQAYVDALAAHIASSFTTRWPDIATLFHSTIRVTHIKVTYISSAGLAQQQAVVALGSVGQGLQGTSATNSLPYEVALAVSLYGYANGQFVAQRARKRGRFYLPAMTTGQMAAGGRILLASRDTVRTWAGSYLTGVNAFSGTGIGGPASVVIASKADNGLATPVTRVRVGDVFDAQRRRRGNQLEAYAEGNVLP